MNPIDPVGPADGVPIHGAVRGDQGSPLGRATLTLISLQGRQLARAVATGDGIYSLSAPGAGSYVLIAAAEGHRPHATTVVVGNEPLAHDVVLSGSGGLSGTVRRAADGLPVDGAMVVVTDVRGEVLATGKTGTGGGFSFDGLPSGGFTLAVNAPGHRPTALPVEVGGQGATRIEVELRAGLHVRGMVQAGSERRPLRDARVTLLDAAGNVAASAITGDDGCYAFTDLEAGDYTLIANGYPPVATSLAVDARGGDQACDVELGHPDGRFS